MRVLTILFVIASSLSTHGIEIILGPIVTNITEDSATVRWMTDSNAYGLVRYGLTEGSMNTTVTNAYLLQQHETILTNLNSGTRYWYEAQATMPDKSSATSAPAWFQTESTSQVDYVSDAYFIGDPKKMMFSANISGSVKKVQFRLDDELIMTDYSAPFDGSALPAAINQNPELFEGEHTVTIEAFDENGVSLVASADLSFLEDCFSRNINVQFINPWRSFTYYTDADTLPLRILTVDVTAYERQLVMRGGSGADFGPDWGRIGEELVPTSYPADHVVFYLNGSAAYTTTTASAGTPTQFRGYIDCTGLSTGLHTVSARASMGDGCGARDFIDVEVVKNLPELEAYCSVTGVMNRFDVTLTVTNVGLGTAYVQALDHDAYGFVTCLTTSSVPATTRNNYWLWSRSSRVTVEFPGGAALAPGEALTVSYMALPIMYPEDYDEYGFGDTFVAYDALSESYYELLATAAALTDDGIALDDAVETACRTSNYLVVTSPGNLTLRFGSEGADQLFSKAAELAVMREGVFGFYDSAMYYAAKWRSGDLCAFADMFENSGDEFFTGDISANRIYAEGGYKEIKVTEGDTRLPVSTPMDEGDDLAAGQVLPLTQGRWFHEREEIVHADASEGHLSIYSYDWTENDLMCTQKLDVGFTSGDRLAIGFVLDDDNAPEILIAQPDDTVKIYTGATSEWRTNATITFGAGDLIACGDIAGESWEQVVFGDISADELRLHHLTGTRNGEINPLDTFSIELDEDDALAVGDIRGGPLEEIVFVDESEDRVHVFDFDPPTDSLREVNDFEYPFYPGDKLGIAKLFNDTQNKLCFVRGDHAGGSSRPGIDIVSYVPGSEGPGDRYGLDSLLNDGGDWEQQMHPDWNSRGYLLFIGGAEIIPAFSDTFDYYGTEYKIDFTDMRFASTDSERQVPELRVGRISGEAVEDMMVPMQTSLDIENGDLQLWRDQAMIIYGGEGGEEIGFRDMSYDGRDILRDDAGFDYFDIHSTPAGYSQVSFCDEATYDDFILLVGHGTATGWDAFEAGYISSNLDISIIAPVVYAASCQTGRYPAENSFAEACSRRGASAYIGATMNGFGDYHFMVAEEFCRRLDNGSAGYALRAAQRDVADDGAVGSPRRARRYNANIMHLFGDPAVEMDGGGGGGSKLAKGSSPTNEWDVMGPVSNISITIPAYTMYETNGVHHVRIPGGLRIAEPGQPVVPTYPVKILFPSGYIVQDVSLSGISNWTQESNLNLPLGRTNIWGTGDGVPGIEGTGGPWPETDFEWTLTDMPDDATLLRITAHPFFYSSTSKSATFYSNFTFAINYESTEAWINRLVLDGQMFTPGDPVDIQLYAFNDAPSASDITAEIRILDVTRGTTVTVHSVVMDGLQGLGAYTYQWDSTSAQPGNYRTELILRNEQNVVLDREVFDFDLQGGRASAADLAIIPSNFFVGDDINISVCATGSGTAVASGFLVLNAKDVNGAPLQTFQWEFDNLQAGQTTCYQTTWSNVPVVARNCRFQAYVLADGAPSEYSYDTGWEDADFWISTVSNGAPGQLVQWWSLPDKEYAVYFTSNLLDGFSCVASNLTATPPVNAYTDTVGGVKGFYQVREY